MRSTLVVLAILLMSLATVAGCVVSPGTSEPSSQNESDNASTSSAARGTGPSGGAQTLDHNKCSPQTLSTIRPLTPSPIASPLSKAKAIAAVEDFIGRKLSSPDISEPKAAIGTWFVTVTEPAGGGVSAIVDAGTGQVMSIVLPQAETTIVKLTADQALAAAKSYMDAHKVPYADLTSSVTLEDTGSSKHYRVAFQGYVNGATVPDTRQLSVDPVSGQVFTFLWRQIPYGPVPSPAIDRQGAIERAVAAACLSPYKIDSIQLGIDPGMVWPGQLVWSVAVSSTVQDEGYAIEVNALTGETRIIGGH